MRIKKLIKNSILICILFIGGCFYLFYFGGFYLSKEESVQEYLKIEEFEDSECIFEIEDNNIIYEFHEKEDHSEYKILNTKRNLLGYKTICYYHGLVDFEEELSIEGGWSRDIGMYIILRRNNPEIRYVELKMNNNNDEYTFSNWLNEYSWKILEYNDWRKGKYYSYDKDGNLLNVTEF